MFTSLSHILLECNCIVAIALFSIVIVGSNDEIHKDGGGGGQLGTTNENGTHLYQQKMQTASPKMKPALQSSLLNYSDSN